MKHEFLKIMITTVAVETKILGGGMTGKTVLRLFQYSRRKIMVTRPWVKAQKRSGVNNISGVPFP